MTYPATPGAPPVVPPEQDIRSNLGRIPGAEKLLAAVSIIILIGWIVSWLSGSGWPRESIFESIFATLSVSGSFVIALLVILKLFGIRILPAAIERHVIAIAALLPILGFLLSLVNPPYVLMKVGGSFVLAYLALITYWRKYIPEFLTRPLATEPSSAAPPLQPLLSPAPEHGGPGSADAPVAFPPPPAVP